SSCTSIVPSNCQPRARTQVCSRLAWQRQAWEIGGLILKIGRLNHDSSDTKEAGQGRRTVFGKIPAFGVGAEPAILAVAVAQSRPRALRRTRLPNLARGGLALHQCRAARQTAVQAGVRA